jgi:hypothetical protein
MADQVIRCDAFWSDDLVAPEDPAWSYLPHLEAISLTRGLAPTLDQGSLAWPYGYERLRSTSADGSGDYAMTATAYVDPVGLIGKFVRLHVPDHGFDWYGYVVADDHHRGPEEEHDNGVDPPFQRVIIGEQIVSVVGLEYFLMRQFVRWTMIKGTPDYRIERAIGFNMGSGLGRATGYEKKGNMDPGGDLFAGEPTTALEWTAAYAVRYLLKYHGPKESGGAYKPIEFELASDADPYLNWFKPVVPTEGHSVYQLLNAIIAPERGLAWRLEIDRGEEDDEFHVVVRVTSLATADIVLPGAVTLPETLRTTALPDVDGHDKVPVINRDLSRHWSRVVCRGARRRAVFTISIPSGTMVDGWLASQESLYKPALGTDPKANDLYRARGMFERVYSVYMIPLGWDGKAGDGSATPTLYACPRLAPGTGSIVGGEPIAMPGLRLLRTLPIKAGWDYTDATAPVANDPTDTSPEWQKPFAVIDIGTGGEVWRFAHKVTDTVIEDQVEKTSFWLHPLDNCAGVKLKPSGGPNHKLGKGRFDDVGSPGAATEHPAEVDPEKVRCTVAGEWDAWCEGIYPIADPSDEPLATLYIDIGERARHDSMAFDTIFDVENGVLKKATTGGLLRDDRKLCEQLAQMAFQWYGEPRATVSLGLAGEDYPVDVLTMITTIGTGAVQETVNALVSSVSHDFRSGTVSVNAGFSELDFTVFG